MITVTTSQGVKQFDTQRAYMIWEAKSCIELGFSWDMYVDYMQQWDEDGSKGLIFDESSYLLIKILGDKAE